MRSLNRLAIWSGNRSGVNSSRRSAREIAFSQSGVNPLEREREGFLRRNARQNRKRQNLGGFENGECSLKPSVVAENSEVCDLEGIYVSPNTRQRAGGKFVFRIYAAFLLDKVK